MENQTVKKKPYKVHPLDEIVAHRKKIVRVKNEDGTTTKMVIDLPYKNTKRYERYEPVINTGNKYPFGSKRQGF